MVGKVKMEDIASKSKIFAEYYFTQCHNKAMDVAKIVEYTALRERRVFIGACKNTGLMLFNTNRI